MTILQNRGWTGWASAAGGAVALAVLANAYIFIVGRPTVTTSGSTIGQTGPFGLMIETIVPYVWLFLYAGLGTAFWLVSRGKPRIPAVAWMIVLLLLICLGYPAYTDNLRNNDIALAGNFVTIGVAALVIGLLWSQSRLAAAFIFPVIVWVSIASVGLVALMTGRSF